MQRLSIGLEIRPQSVFTAFMALLPSANYSSELTGRVWQPSAESNGRLAHFFASNGHFNLHRAVVPFWMGKTAISEYIGIFLRKRFNM
jgi:hypothetical protein